MGYNLTIGKKYFNKSMYEDVYNDYIEDGETEEQAREWAKAWKYRAESEHHDDAPAFGEPTDYSNDRWPSYGSWFDFCEAAGVTQFIFDDQRRSLRGGHPGYFVMDKTFAQKINAAYKMFSIKYPDAVPTFDDTHPNADKVCFPYNTPQNHTKARFVWLNYWVQYAVKEYGEDAIFYNS